MATKIDNAEVEIEIKPEKAQKALEKFERDLEKKREQQELKLSREGEKAREELERDRVQSQKKLKAFTANASQGVQDFVRSGAVASLTKFLPSKLQPFARPAVNLAELTAEFGPAASKGILRSAPIDPITKLILMGLVTKAEFFSKSITELKSAMQAIAPTVDQVASIGLALARGPGGEHLDDGFLPDYGEKLYDFNKAQIQARRLARKIGVEFTAATITAVISRGFER